MIPQEAIVAAFEAWRDTPVGGDALMNTLTAAAPFLRAQALEYAAEAIDWIRPEMGPGINITPYREGRNDALTSAASWLNARAVTERGGE